MVGRMSHRALFWILTCVATWEIGTVAIAHAEIAEVSRSPLLAQTANLSSETESPGEPPANPGIRSLQSRLAELGYYDGPVDGVYSPGTRQALVEFQRASGLAATGIVDPLTEERLNSAVPDASSGAAADTLQLPSADSELPDPPAEEPAAPASSAEKGGTPGGTDGAEPAEPDGDTPEAGDAELTLPDANPDAAPTAETEAGEATTDAANPDAETPEVSQETSGEGRLIRLALVGLGIILLGGIGATVLLVLLRRGSTAAESEASTFNGNGANPDAHREGDTHLTDRAVHNGNAAASESPNSSSDAAIATPPTSQPRLARVNIIEELVQDLDSPDPTLRRKAIWELGQRGNSAAVQPLVRLMMDADSHEQSLILAALAEISTQTLKPMNRALALSLQDDNPEVRKNAIRDLTRIYDSLGQVGKMLGYAANDADPNVRQTAHWALNQLNNLRLSATETAGMLPEQSADRERLPGEEPSSQSL